MEFKYIGIDTKKGSNVDIVLKDPYKLSSINDASIDILISNSTFEHTEFFWLSFLEILRVLKPNGLFYLNAPFNGEYHRYPLDCWRFYPDSGIALVNWGKKNNYNPLLLESFVNKQYLSGWNDFVAVILKDTQYKNKFSSRIIDKYNKFFNGITNNSNDMKWEEAKNFQRPSEDQSYFSYKIYYQIRNLIQKLFQW